jgi:hypothetical protein
VFDALSAEAQSTTRRVLEADRGFAGSTGGVPLDAGPRRGGGGSAPRWASAFSSSPAKAAGSAARHARAARQATRQHDLLAVLGAPGALPSVSASAADLRAIGGGGGGGSGSGRWGSASQRFGALGPLQEPIPPRPATSTLEAMRSKALPIEAADPRRHRRPATTTWLFDY